MIRKLLMISLYVILIAGIQIYYLSKVRVIDIPRKSPPFYLINDMDRLPSPRNQSLNEFFDDKINIRDVPEKSVPINAEYYPFESVEYNLAENRLIVRNNRAKYNFLYGEHLFKVHCAYCHNYDGKGSGAIISRINLTEDEEGFPNPPDLTDSVTIKKSDNRLFHIISAGQNLMMPINHKLSDDERWALVNYLRFLQNNK